MAAQHLARLTTTLKSTATRRRSSPCQNLEGMTSRIRGLLKLLFANHQTTNFPCKAFTVGFGRIRSGGRTSPKAGRTASVITSLWMQYVPPFFFFFFFLVAPAVPRPAPSPYKDYIELTFLSPPRTGIHSCSRKIVGRFERLATDEPCFQLWRRIHDAISKAGESEKKPHVGIIGITTSAIWGQRPDNNQTHGKMPRKIPCKERPTVSKRQKRTRTSTSGFKAVSATTATAAARTRGAAKRTGPPSVHSVPHDGSTIAWYGPCGVDWGPEQRSWPCGPSLGLSCIMWHGGRIGVSLVGYGGVVWDVFHPLRALLPDSPITVGGRCQRSQMIFPLAHWCIIGSTRISGRDVEWSARKATDERMIEIIIIVKV